MKKMPLYTMNAVMHKTEIIIETSIDSRDYTEEYTLLIPLLFLRVFMMKNRNLGWGAMMARLYSRWCCCCLPARFSWVLWECWERKIISSETADDDERESNKWSWTVSILSCTKFILFVVHRLSEYWTRTDVLYCAYLVLHKSGCFPSQRHIIVLYLENK
jgi:hypothetical protein